MKEGPNKPVRLGEDRIEQIRKEIEAMSEEPEFQNLSRTLQRTLAQRLGIEEFKEGGLVLQADVPGTMRQLLEDARIPPDELKDKLDAPYAYGNVYSYSFW